MTEQGWKRVALGLGIVVVVLLGVSGAMLMTGGSGSPAVPTASPGIGEASASPLRSPSPQASTPPSGGASASPSAAPSASPSPSPSPSAAPKVPKAAVRIANLQVDDPAATDAEVRTFVVITDGPGSMTAKLAGARGGKVKFCIQADLVTPFCGNYNAGVTLTGKTAKTGQTRFTVTAIGATSGSAPVAIIDIAFFAKVPTLEFSGLRIDPGRGPAGLDARVTTRGPGSLELQSTLTDASTTGLAASAPWRVKVVGLDGGFTPQDLTDTGATVQVATDVTGPAHFQVTLGAQQGTSPTLVASGVLTWP